MKILSILSFGSIFFGAAAMAETTYSCDYYEVLSGEYSGMDYTVVINNGAKVFSKKAERLTHPDLTYTLDVWSGNGDKFFNSNVQDARVKFTIANNSKAGVLTIQSTMPQQNGSLAPAKVFLCPLVE